MNEKSKEKLLNQQGKQNSLNYVSYLYIKITTYKKER